MKKSTTLAALSALALTLSACGGSAQSQMENSSSSPTASAGLNGSGASSQVNAQQAWRDNFGAQTSTTINYDPTGSGTGREQFINGQVDYIGTDSMLDEEEIAAATTRCMDTEPLELPLYISPIAIAFNLEGIESVNMTAEVIAGIFDGKITNWNDPAIAEINEGVELPDLQIIPVNRADDSGTTENFQEYLIEAAGNAWPYEASDTWPRTGTQSAEKTSGVINLVNSTPGAITYADASQVGELGTAAIEVSGEFLPYSPEAAAAIVDNSEPTEDATDRRLTVELKRDGSIAEAYPVVMISYLVACTNYADPAKAQTVKDYFTYMASAEGQETAANAGGGNAPISDALRERVTAAIDMIETN